MSKHKIKYDFLISIPLFFSAFLFIFSSPAISQTLPQNQRALCQSVLHCKTKQCILAHGFLPVRDFFSQGCDRVFMAKNGGYIGPQYKSDESSIYYFPQNNGTIRAYWFENGRENTVFIRDRQICAWINNVFQRTNSIEKANQPMLFNELASLCGYKTRRKYIELYEQPGKRNVTYNARMVGHGLLCIATGGLWEIAYYPIEKSLSDILVVEATYSNVASNRIEKISVYQSY